MPTVLRWRGWIFFFYSADLRERPHIHVRKGRQEAKFWLDDGTIAAVRRIPDHELNILRQEVWDRRAAFMEAWREHLG